MVFKKRFRRAKARNFAAKYTRRGKSGFSSGLIQIDAMAYGAVRPYISNLMAPLTNMIPAGNLADEISMGLVDYLVAKKIGGTIGKIASKGLIIENAMIGSSVSSGLLSSNKTTSPSSVMFG